METDGLELEIHGSILGRAQQTALSGDVKRVSPIDYDRALILILDRGFRVLAVLGDLEVCHLRERGGGLELLILIYLIVKLVLLIQKA